LFCLLERSTMYGQASPPAPPGIVTMQPFIDEQRRREVLHMNKVMILTRVLAPTYPMFKASQLLISPRNLDAIAVLDPGSGKVAWAARGPWRAQHDPTFLDKGVGLGGFGLCRCHLVANHPVGAPLAPRPRRSPAGGKERGGEHARAAVAP
jgi:hypothetical protein